MRLMLGTVALALWVVAGVTSAMQEGQLAKGFGSRTITRVGMVVRDAKKTASAYADTFGVPMSAVTETRPPAYPKDYKGDKAAHTRVVNVQFDNMTLEIAEPVGGRSPWREFLDTKGEGFHHIAFDVDDVEENV